MAARRVRRGDPGAAAAPTVTVPVLFPRADCLTLFGLLRSAGKTLHANPGGHLGVPPEEFEAAVWFLGRHLGPAGGGAAGAAGAP